MLISQVQCIEMEVKEVKNGECFIEENMKRSI
jgi:hypothetical protein